MADQANPLLDRFRRRVPIGPGTLAGAAAMLLGMTLLMTGANRWWLVEVHVAAKSAPMLPETAWAAFTLLGFGWPLLIVGLTLGWAQPHRCAVLLRAALACAVLSPVLKALFRSGRPVVSWVPMSWHSSGNPSSTRAPCPRDTRWLPSQWHGPWLRLGVQLAPGRVGPPCRR